MPKVSYKKMMAEIIKKKNTMTTAQKDKQKIKENTGGGKIKKVDQI